MDKPKDIEEYAKAHNSPDCAEGGEQIAEFAAWAVYLQKTLIEAVQYLETAEMSYPYDRFRKAAGMVVGPEKTAPPQECQKTLAKDMADYEILIKSKLSANEAAAFAFAWSCRNPPKVPA